MRLDYRKETFSKVSVCGVECKFNDMRIERSSVPEGRYQYEVAGDDDSGGDPVRVQPGVLINFYDTLISDRPLPLGEDGVLWLNIPYKGTFKGEYKAPLKDPLYDWIYGKDYC